MLPEQTDKIPMFLTIPEPVAKRSRRERRIIPSEELDKLKAAGEAGESLRELAVRFDCSHEAIRNTLARTRAQ